MENPTSNPKRFSAIPLPRHSKLPLPGTPVTTTTNTSRPSSTLGYASTTAPNRGSLQQPQPSKRGSVSVNHEQQFARPTPVLLPPQRRSNVERQAANGSLASTKGQDIAKEGEELFKRPRGLSLKSSIQQNGVHMDDSDQGSYTDETIGSASGSISPIKHRKASRPSLSDRTIESLSSIPPSPGTDRRRSSFFSPQSPMTPQRPPSAVDGLTTGISKLNYGSVRQPNPARPVSPTKPVGVIPIQPCVRRNTAGSSISVPKVGVPRPRSPTKSTQAVKPAAVTTKPVPNSTPKPTRDTARPNCARKVEATRIRPPSPVKRQTDAPTRHPPTEVVKSPTTKGSSSTALRQHIAQAKANTRKVNGTTSNESTPNLPAAEFDFVENPFNQRPKDGKDELRRKIDVARRDGRLNIAAMGFKELPDEVLKMYDPESMEASSVPWSETVDLVRLNAADNELAELGDATFPDASPESLGTSDESKGNQFGGLDNLDVHGNRLKCLPLGLRQLTRLTCLNLARNQLDNWAFDIITQIPTLCDLNLANNNLSQELPESLSQLALLESLDVSSNRLVSLPTTLRDLSRLKLLHLSSNRLASIPFDQLSNLPRLADINASSNALTGALFPSSVTAMPHLRTLDVSDNAVASLNFSKTLNLPNLIRLDVSRNRLGMFPSIAEWSCLTMLLADENALSELPKGMINLKTRLRTVSLERNSLRDLDEGVGEMEGLEVLALGGNPLRERRMLSMDLDGIKRELERRKELAREVSGAS